MPPPARYPFGDRFGRRPTAPKPGTDVRIEVTLHPAQYSIAQDNSRFRVVASGRRFGKTVLAAMLSVEAAAQGKRVWWVAPTYGECAFGWREIRKVVLQIPGTKASDYHLLASFPSGGFVQCKTGEDPRKLRGEGLGFVVLEEAAFLEEEVWEEAIRPSLVDSGGRAVFISTPHGRNWFYHLFLNGRQGREGFASFQHPTWDNPHITPAEIEHVRRTQPDAVFRQEYGAEFVEDVGLVFRPPIGYLSLEQYARAATLAVKGEPSYACGVDWGKARDFTVFSVLDLASGRQVHQDRMTGLDYTLQIERLRGIHAKFRPVVYVVEANSIGDPLIEQLRVHGLPVWAYYMSSATKAIAIESLAGAIERGECHILPDRDLLREMLSFTADRTPSGAVRYSVPAREHDDTVISLALAWQARAHPLEKATRTPYVLSMSKQTTLTLSQMSEETWKELSQTPYSRPRVSA